VAFLFEVVVVVFIAEDSDTALDKSISILVRPARNLVPRTDAVRSSSVLLDALVVRLALLLLLFFLDLEVLLLEDWTSATLN